MGSVDVQKNFNSIPMLGVVVEPVNSDPGSPIEGRIWTRSDLDTLKVFLGAVAKTLATTDDSRFTDSRPPNGSAGGDLTGTYPNPTIGANKVTSSHIVDGTIVAGDLAPGVIPSGLPPNGAAGGDLAGTYPNPTIGANKIIQSYLARALIQSGYASGTALTTDVALRRLGTFANDAMPGVSTLRDISDNNLNNGAIDMNSFKINNVLAGTLAGDAVNLQQLQDAISGLDVKASCRMATTGSVTLSGLQTIDGVSGVANDRVLVKNNATDNHIYIMKSGAWTIAPDADSIAEEAGAFTFIERGTQQGTGWVAKGNISDLSATVWTQFSSSASITAGAGLVGSSTFDVNADGSSIEVVADVVRVKALGITNAMLAGSIDLTSKVTGTLPITNGGTGGTTAAAARTNLGVPGKSPTTSPALTAGVWADVPHGLSYMPSSIIAKIAATGELVDVDFRDKPGAETSIAQMKVDIPGGRASGYYSVWFVG